MKLERKAAPQGVLIEDEGDGIVTALVSVTGIVDNVKDIIEPGTYARTLSERKPKGIWHHTWTDPIAKTIHAEELMPGDPRLPKKLANGQPWPKEAGALQIKMQFNLDSDHGRRAYSNVKFFGDEQEWSIGYQVPPGGSTKDQKTGIRRIKDIDLYEYSPVLFGAMTHARTVQQAKMLISEFENAGIDLKELFSMTDVEVKLRETKPPADDENESDELDEYADEDFEDEEDEEDAKSHTGLEAGMLRKAIDALTELLQAVSGSEGGPEPLDDEKHAPIAYIEAKALEHLNLTEALDALTFDVPSEMSATAAVFDDAHEAGNEKAMDKAGTAVMDLLEKFDNEVGDDEAKHNALKVVAQVISDMFYNRAVKDAEGKAFRWTSDEYKLVPIASRQQGWPVCTDGIVSRKSLQQAYLSQLEDDDLIAVSDWLSEAKCDRSMLRYVGSLLDYRRDGKAEEEIVDSEAKVLEAGAEGFIFDLEELKNYGVELDVK